MEEHKIVKYGFYISLISLAIACITLVLDILSFIQNTGELGNYFEKGSPKLTITIALVSFIVGYLVHKVGVFKYWSDKLITIKNPKILVAFTVAEIFGNDENIILQSKISKSVTPIKDVSVEKLTTYLSSNEYDIVHFGIPIDLKGTLEIRNEKITSNGLINLLQLSKTKLLILGSCSSINLVSNSNSDINIIAATEIMDSASFEKWETMFYSLLASGKQLTEAFNISKSVFDHLPLTMILKQDMKIKNT